MVISQGLYNPCLVSLVGGILNSEVLLNEINFRNIQIFWNLECLRALIFLMESGAFLTLGDMRYPTDKNSLNSSKQTGPYRLKTNNIL